MIELFINPSTTPASVQQKATGAPTSTLRLKRGATVHFGFTILGVDSAANLKFGVKAKNDFEGALLALSSAVEGRHTEHGTRFEVALTVASDALNTAFGVGSGGHSLAVLPCVSEITWEENGIVMMSDTLTTTIINDIVRSAVEAPDMQLHYPAPDLVATRQWVQELRATAAMYGLVMLESDAIVEGEYTAVALTRNGTICVPAASYDMRGTVRLGTDKLISGAGVLPVGETASGRLAVNADGLRGEVGPQGEVGPKGEAGKVYFGAATADDGTANCNINWWKLSGMYNMGGQMRELRVPSRRSGNGSETTMPMYMSVWYEAADGTPQHLGYSTNTQTFVAGQAYVWEFDDLELPRGSVLRFCPVPNTETPWEQSSTLGVRTFDRVRGDTTSSVQGAAALALTVACTMEVSVTNITDFVQRREVAELLARKEEILAMLPAVTSEEVEDE